MSTSTTQSTRLRDSSIPQQFKLLVESEVTFPAPAGGVPTGLNIRNEFDGSYSNDCVDMFDTVIMALAELCAKDKFKAKDKQAIGINGLENGAFIAALLIDYDDEAKCNSFAITFDPLDVKGYEVTNLIDITEFPYIVNETLYGLHRKNINDITIINQMVVTTFKAIHQWLDSNASDGNVVELIIDGAIDYQDQMSKEEFDANAIEFASAKVQLVNGVKKFSITFGEEIKAIAKGNSDTVSSEKDEKEKEEAK